MEKLLAAAAVTVALFCGNACAELKICNEFSETLFVAAGSERDKAVTTLGWWEVAPGECTVINKGKVIIPTYVHVETQTKRTNTGSLERYEWGKDKTLGVVRDTDKFERKYADKLKAGDDAAQFADVTKSLLSPVDGVTYTIGAKDTHIGYTCSSDQALSVSSNGIACGRGATK